MRGTLRKYSVLVSGHKTSVSLELEFWQALAEIARSRGSNINRLVAEIDRDRAGNLSSAIRVFVLNSYRETPPATALPVRSRQ